MTTILITNAYSAGNCGDAAIVLGMIESLRRTERFADADIIVSSSDPAGDAEAYGVRVVESFQSVSRGVASSPVIARLWFVMLAVPLSLLWAGARRLLGIDLPVGRGLRRLLRTYAQADLVIAAGGGYLYTTSAARGHLVLLAQVYAFVYGRILGKPVVLYAQSIGPFAGGLQAWCVGRSLRLTTMVQVREAFSRDLVEAMNIGVPIRLVTDAAFLLEAKAPGRPDGRWVGGSGGPVVGVTVRQWFRIGDDQHRYERVMGSFVRWVAEDLRMQVVFLPQVTACRLADDDRSVALRIADLAGRPDAVLVLEDEFSASELKWLCGRMDYFVGTRMHSNIFAISTGVPTLAVAYQSKTEGIMGALGLGDWVVPIEGLSLEGLQRAFGDLLDQGPGIREFLASMIRELEHSALEGGRLIAEAFEPQGPSGPGASA